MKTAIAIAASLSLSAAVTNAAVARSLLGVNTLADSNGRATSCINDDECKQHDGAPGVCLKTGAGHSYCVSRRSDCDGGHCECNDDDECVSGQCSPYPAIDEQTGDITGWPTDGGKRCEPAMVGALCLSAADCVSRNCVGGTCAKMGPASPTYLTPCLTNAHCPSPRGEASQTCMNGLCKANAQEQCGMQANATFTGQNGDPLPCVITTHAHGRSGCPASYICTDVDGNPEHNVCKKRIVMYWESASRLYQRGEFANTTGANFLVSKKTTETVQGMTSVFPVKNRITREVQYEHADESWVTNGTLCAASVCMEMPTAAGTSVDVCGCDSDQGVACPPGFGDE